MGIKVDGKVSRKPSADGGPHIAAHQQELRTERRSSDIQIYCFILYSLNHLPVKLKERLPLPFMRVGWVL